jgi:3-hydroxybutyryl-CoA dehydrogenase
VNIQSICIGGAGTMGSGIAQVSAQAGFRTLLYDLNEDVLARARSSIGKSLSFLVEKTKISEGEKEKILDRIEFVRDLSECSADLFIEAIIENLEAKVALFKQMAQVGHSESIFASNTSSLSITTIAEQLATPERLIGLHFFNPATIMKLVEVVNTVHTPPHITELVIDLMKSWGKKAVVCKDSPGFIVNRIARPYYIETLRLVEKGVASFESADRMLESIGFKMGPFKLMDLIGNDVNYAVSQSVYEQLGSPERLKPSYIQQQKVDKGELGKKTGTGYYRYS